MKYLLGWIEPSPVCLGCAGGVPARERAELPALGTQGSAYMLLGNPGGMDWTSDGRGSGEYFVLENRQRRHGFYESFLPASGMLIWKIDETRGNNNLPGGRLAEVIQADGEAVGAGAGAGQVPGEASDFWPRPDGQGFTPYTDPASALSGGRFSGAAVENIAEDAAGLVTADLKVGLPRRGRAYAYPNPYSLAALRAGAPLRIVFIPDTGPPRPYPLQVTIFDAEGRPIRRLSEDRDFLPDGTALWDGHDRDGKPVDAGLYFYSVRASDQEATGIIAIKE
jgi:hypothetical protein